MTTPASSDPLSEPAPGPLSTAAPRASVREAGAEAPPESGAPRGSSVPASSGEPSAREWLEQRGVSSAWEQRAAWLESEANAQSDGAARARLLMAASEVRAICGARNEARRLALRAGAEPRSPLLAVQQARALAPGDAAAALKGLREEARRAKQPSLRAHAHYALAEALRLLQHDDAGADAALDAAEQIDPTDFRPILQRLARQLGRSPRPADARLPPDDAFRPVRHAVNQLARLRGAEAPRLAAPELTAIHLVEAQRAFCRGKRAETADLLAELESRPGLRAPIRWLRLLWRSSAADDAPALASLAELVQESPRRVERRALAARALAAGDTRLVIEALDAEPQTGADAAASSRGAETSPAFSTSERISLGALVGRALDAGPDTAESPALVPLMSALTSLGLARHAPVRAATPAAAEFALGRAAARLQRFAEYEPPAEVTETDFCDTLLRLERAREQRAPLELAAHLPRFAARPAARAECCYVAGVWAEAAGDDATARELYRLALASPATREPAVRALSGHAADAAAMFRSLSANTSDPGRRGGLLVEALLRLQPEAAELDALAEEAARCDPDQALIQHLAERAARIRGDRARVARWLARQRERARGLDDFPLAAIREASFLAQTDPKAASQCLDAAIPYTASDRGLRRRRESWGEIPALERALARQHAAQASSSREREHAWFEALALYLTAGDPRAALMCARELSAPLAAPWVERLATQVDDQQWLLSFWKRELENAGDAELVSEIHERLAALELARGSRDQAVFWQRERLKHEPGSLSALRFLAVQNMTSGCEQELERAAAELSTALAGPESIGHAFLAARLAVDRGAYADARIHAERAAASAEPPLWALRLRAEHARDSEHHALQLALSRELREHARDPLDVVALSLRAAEAALDLGNREAAAEELARAHVVAPDHVVVLDARVELARDAAPAIRAEALEALAGTTQSPPLRVDLWLQAAVIWLEGVGELPRALQALEQAADAGPQHPALAARVRELLARSPELEGLAALARRIRVEQGPSLAAELARAQALADDAKDSEARQLVESLLALHPRHAGALALSATLHFRAGAWTLAEQAWLSALEAAPTGADVVPTLHNLAQLYEEQLDDAERKRQIYSRLLEHEPDDALLRRRLIQLLSESNQHDAAAQHQRELLLRSSGDEDRRRALLELVELLARVENAGGEAEQLLERAQRTWTEDISVLRATVEHYQRTGNGKSARAISERAVNAARNAIQAGRVEANLFHMLEAAARLAGDPGLARLARGALAALHGQPGGLEGAGSAVADLSFDELFAPPPLSLGLRRLLYEAGSALERTYAIDPHVLSPRPLPAAQADEAERVASQFGLENVRVMVSDEIGFDCVYLHASPGCIIFGSSLLEHDNRRVRDFALLRALKLAQSNSSALAHMPAAELWAAVAGFLACFGPAWPAQGADAQRLVTHRNKIRPHMTAALGPELSALVPAITSNVVPRAALIGDALWSWACRVALLGIGDVSAAVEALFRSAHRDRPLPKDAASWSRWIAASDQARDLVGYSISEAYTEARRRAGLSTDQR